MTAHPTEEELMAAYARGDASAFERLFGRLAPAIHGFFSRSFGSATADDLLQMTFLKIHRARARYQPGRPLRPWVFTIAARVRLDELRRKYALPEELDEEKLNAAADAAAARSAVEDSGGDRAERAQRVRDALARLPESQRVVVHLHRYEGMTFAQIAQVLGSTEGAVKLRAFRAYERLREELRDLVTGGEDPVSADAAPRSRPGGSR